MISTPSLRPAWLLALLVLFLTHAYAAPMQLNFGGYLQARYTDALGDGQADGTFRTNRVYLLARASDQQHVYAQVLLFGDTDVHIHHAFAEYQANPMFYRLGLSPVPFGYENPVTAARLVTLERSQASNVLIGPYALDRGAFVFFQPGAGLNAAVGVVNGQPLNVASDNNSTKNLVGRLGYHIPGGEVGVSLYDGSNTAGARMDRLALDVLTRQGPFTIVSELITGTTGNVDAIGGYATLAYRPTGARLEPYARFDAFDPNRDAGNDYYRRVTAGMAYYVNPSSKISLEYEAINDNANPDLDGRITMQYQIGY